MITVKSSSHTFWDSDHLSFAPLRRFRERGDAAENCDESTATKKSSDECHTIIDRLAKSTSYKKLSMDTAYNLRQLDRDSWLFGSFAAKGLVLQHQYNF